MPNRLTSEKKQKSGKIENQNIKKKIRKLHKIDNKS